jgi:hypothetical protein
MSADGCGSSESAFCIEAAGRLTASREPAPAVLPLQSAGFPAIA